MMNGNYEKILVNPLPVGWSLQLELLQERDTNFVHHIPLLPRWHGMCKYNDCGDFDLPHSYAARCHELWPMFLLSVTSKCETTSAAFFNFELILIWLSQLTSKRNETSSFLLSHEPFRDRTCLVWSGYKRKTSICCCTIFQSKPKSNCWWGISV